MINCLCFSVRYCVMFIQETLIYILIQFYILSVIFFLERGTHTPRTPLILLNLPTNLECQNELLIDCTVNLISTTSSLSFFFSLSLRGLLFFFLPFFSFPRFLSSQLSYLAPEKLAMLIETWAFLSNTLLFITKHMNCFSANSFQF